jgi:hypothetical protein
MVKASPKTARVHTCLAVVLCLALFALTGCGGKGNVHGKVYFKDKPLSGGAVTFLVNKKTVGKSQILEDGSYDMRDVPAGEVTIVIIPGSPIGGKAKTPPEALPKEITDPDKSTEKITITSGDQERDIRLK